MNYPTWKSLRCLRRQSLGVTLVALACAAMSPCGSAQAQETAPADMAAVRQLPAEVQSTLDKLQVSLKAARGAGDGKAEARALNQIGDFYLHASYYGKALDNYDLALTAARAAIDLPQEAAALNGIGNCYRVGGDNKKAPEMYQQALDLATASNDDEGQATALIGLGWVYNTLGQNEKALGFYNRALAPAQRANVPDVEARALRRIGLAYYTLGEMKKALEYYKQSLPVFQQLHDSDREATVLNDIGLVYSDLGEKQTALGYYKKSLPMFHQIGDLDGEALTLTDIGEIYGNLGDAHQEMAYYEKSLPLLGQVGDRGAEAKTLNGIGRAYTDLGEQQKALDSYFHALTQAAQINDPILEAVISYNLMCNLRASQPALAIFYGKQAVNLLQQVRGNIQGLDKQLQKDFLASKDGYYRDLADLLIGQGRLPEAQEVLDLLKEQEYSDYVRGDSAKMLSPLTLTPAEEQAEREYQESTARIGSISEQWAQLRKVADRTPEQEQQYQQISSQIETANKGLDRFYEGLYKLFGEGAAANHQEAVVEGKVSQLKKLLANMPHTVALYTLVAKDRTSIIVIAGSVPVARESAISEEDLNKKVAAFQQALRDRGTNPKPMAQELYKILIGPVKADLDQAQAETLVWSLDGALRYIPMAALYDGKKYLVESYNTVTLNPDGIDYLTDKPDLRNLSAAAMGISQEYEANLPSLPAVANELDDIVKDPKAQEAHGVLPGSILLDNQFTEKGMEKEMETSRSVVHIASHFVFKPGDNSKSYLLLAGKDAGGNGFHLTVADFSANQKLDLLDTDLLTLSACETGISSSASNGREVDGLGMTAQKKGAKAVISSLWAVDDASTGDLMADFYRRWAEGMGSVQKVEALRLAQLDLLLGRVTPDIGVGARGFSNAKTGRDMPAGFAHPYYWAPFVLMGNWK